MNILLVSRTITKKMLRNIKSQNRKYYYATVYISSAFTFYIMCNDVAIHNRKDMAKVEKEK